MLETPHVIIGAAIATKVSQPALSIPLALMSHFLLERVPHWNPHLNTEMKKYGKVTKKSTYTVIADATLALTIGTYISVTKSDNFAQFATIMFACFFSILPDLIESPYFFFKYDNPYIQKWIKFQKSLQSDTSIFPGLATQILVSAIGLWSIFS